MGARAARVPRLVGGRPRSSAEEPRGGQAGLLGCMAGEGVERGVRAMHGLTKLKQKWVPTVVESAPGQSSSDP
eukprot:3547539-Pyramimonas_sp.AAC.1